MSADDTPSLDAVRAAIDAVDSELVALLARRQDLVGKVVAIKRRDGLPARIPSRIEAVVAGVRARAAETGLDPDLAERVWRAMIAGFVEIEEAELGPVKDGRG
jgi:isochorismate pyruvate lyase